MDALMPPRAEPHEVLRRVFGFPAFRGLQEEAVTQVLGGGDALVLMPTGAGKSVCYQVPALCRPGTAIVISPLIALMDDQVAAMRQLGVAAGALHSELDPEEQRRVGRALDAGELDLIYVSPERLMSLGTQERLSRQMISLVAIDEAHCVSQWGHEFRTEYRDLACLPRLFPGVPRIALTATADPRTREDILRALDMPDAKVLVASFHRANLQIGAAAKQSETTQLMELLRRHEGEAGIVYCGTRAKTERTAAALNAKGIGAVAFHAGLPPGEKRAAAGRFRSGEAVVVVATIAFGMGIDRPDVRFVAHLDMPDSPEAFYQQIGRAGRDGEAAETLLLYGGEDIARARFFLTQSNAPETQKAVMRSRLEAMVALAETAECRTRALLACFGETMAEACGHCDVCTDAPVSFDGTVEAQKVLSAVFRTGQRFGGQHVIAVLTGKATEAIVRWEHDRLPTFGVGADRPVEFWRGVIRQLIARGALEMEVGEYPTLRLDPERARPILRGEERVTLREAAAKPRRAGPRVRLASQADAAGVNGREAQLFEALRQWRSQEARTQAVPPYVIFHDAVLRDIAAGVPADLVGLGQVRGVGASKLARYGERVLEILRAS
jgi:ATP-dependent DNA helicase RecQ